MSRMREHFSLVVPLDSIFEAPLLMDLAQRIEHLKAIHEYQNTALKLEIEGEEVDEGWI